MALQTGAEIVQQRLLKVPEAELKFYRNDHDLKR